MEDIEIVNQIKDRQEKGLSNLYDKYAASLNGIIIRIVRNASLAEEVLSNTMLKAWNKIESYDESKSNLFTWLAAIARNSAIDKARLKSFKNNQKTDTITDHVYKIGFSNNQAKIDTERLTKLIDYKYRIVLEKMYLEGYSQSQIAKELDIPLGTVKTRVRKALQILRKALQSEINTFYGTYIYIILIMQYLL